MLEYHSAINQLQIAAVIPSFLYSLKAVNKNEKKRVLFTFISAEVETPFTWININIFGNGYPARRRSLVVDAKFESQVNKETKNTLIKEYRQQSSAENDLSDEEVFLAPEISLGSDDPQEVSLLITLRDGISSLARIIKTIENLKGNISHLETRCSQKKSGQFDVLCRLMISRPDLITILKTLKQSSAIHEIVILSEGKVSIKGIYDIDIYVNITPWFPKHISELDLCNHLVTKYEPDMDHDHPGFTDKVYRQRRQEIAQIAFNYRHGDKIAIVEYTPDEISTWGAVYKELVDLFETHACTQHIKVFRILEKECGYRKDNIPQLQDVSDFMYRRSGFQLRPAAGLVTARDFLSSLAFRVFLCTQYVRHSSSPNHSPEPDCVHELLGHIPMLVDPSFAQFSQEIGLASIAATDEEIEKLATLYWFTVEFGLCKENGKVKAYGAGLLSSYGELMHALSDKPERRAFDPVLTAIQTYQDQDYQDVYYVTESIEDAKEKFRWYVSKKLSRPYDIHYDPYTQSICILDSIGHINKAIQNVRAEINHLSSAILRVTTY
ncbi:Tyrosine 3-monooxygenase [Nymphon striatum]|nr:Tyrosine 3-monooxygenase [Nymphon striatum]